MLIAGKELGFSDGLCKGIEHYKSDSDSKYEARLPNTPGGKLSAFMTLISSLCVLFSCSQMELEINDIYSPSVIPPFLLDLSTLLKTQPLFSPSLKRHQSPPNSPRIPAPPPFLPS